MLNRSLFPFLGHVIKKTLVAKPNYGLRWPRTSCDLVTPDKYIVVKNDHWKIEKQLMTSWIQTLNLLGSKPPLARFTRASLKISHSELCNENFVPHFMTNKLWALSQILTNYLSSHSRKNCCNQLGNNIWNKQSQWQHFSYRHWKCHSWVRLNIAHQDGHTILMAL